MSVKKLINFIEERPGVFAIMLSLLLHLTLLVLTQTSSSSKTIRFGGRAVKVKLTAAPGLRPSIPARPKKNIGQKKLRGLTSSRKHTKTALRKKPGRKKGRGTSSYSDKEIFDILNEIGTSSHEEEAGGIFDEYSSGPQVMGKGGEDAISGALWTHYAEKLWKIIRTKWTPPPGGGKMAVVVAVIDPQGNLISVKLEKSSGNPSFDARAVEAVKKAAPFPPPPVKERVEIAFRFLRE